MPTELKELFSWILKSSIGSAFSKSTGSLFKRGTRSRPRRLKNHYQNKFKIWKDASQMQDKLASTANTPLA